MSIIARRLRQLAAVIIKPYASGTATNQLLSIANELDRWPNLSARAKKYGDRIAPELRHRLNELTAEMIAKASVETFLRDQDALYSEALRNAYLFGARDALREDQ